VVERKRSHGPSARSKLRRIDQLPVFLKQARSYPCSTYGDTGERPVDPLILSISPWRTPNLAHTVYEDSGHTEDYQRTLAPRPDVTATQSGEELTVTVAPVVALSSDATDARYEYASRRTGRPPPSRPMDTAAVHTDAKQHWLATGGQHADHHRSCRPRRCAPDQPDRGAPSAGLIGARTCWTVSPDALRRLREAYDTLWRIPRDLRSSDDVTMAMQTANPIGYTQNGPC